MNQTLSCQRVTLSRPLPAILLILVGVALDQWLKYLVESHLPFEQVVKVLPMVSLYRTWNVGIAFSMLSDQNGLMIIVLRLVIVSAVIWWWRRSLDAGSLAHLGFILIITGAIGNLVDRFVYGHVVDYILFHTQSWSFAVFNLADSLITVGAVMVGIYELFPGRFKNMAKPGDL